MIVTVMGMAAVAGGLALFFYWAIHRTVAILQTAGAGSLMDTSAGFADRLRVAMNTDSRAWVVPVSGGAIGALLGSLGGGVAMIAGAGIGAILPVLWSRMAAAKRRRTMETQLVVTLETMTSAMKAGLSITQAIESTQRTLDRPMLDEFSIMVRQLKVGLQLEEVLQQFAERNPSPDVKLAVSTILISNRTGADLVTAMERLTTTIKRRGLVEAKIHTLTMSGKAQSVLASIFPFGLLGCMMIFDYDYAVVMFTTTLGNFVLLGVAVMQGIAFFVINKVTAIDV